MKRSSLWNLFFGAMMAVVLTVTGCVDDNEDKGAPYLEVTPTTLAFDEEGQPADEWNGVFTVQTNRPWRATVEEEQSWVRLSATEGEGDASIAVSMPASNQGRTAKVTFAIYNSYGDLQTQVVTVAQGEIVAPTVIFNETMGTAQLDSQSWPYVADYTGWTTTGTGAEGVTFEGYNASLRNSGKSSSGAYEGASGPNVIFFGGAPATFTVKNIALTSEQTKLRLTFGGQFYDGSTNNFNVDNFEVALSADGTSFTPITYTVNDGDQVDPYWVLATSDFTLKEATSSLYIRFTAKTSSVYRLDDVTLQTGNGGQEVDLKGGVTPPDPSGDAIYSNNFDKTLAAKDSSDRWPYLDQSDAWKNATGSGNSTVTYASSNVSVRSSSKQSGGYDGASGQNKIFFGSAPANFDIMNITLPSGKTNFRIVFGGAYAKNNSGSYDNTFKPESFHVAVGNGTTWVENLTYEKIGGDDTTDPYWLQFAVDFTLKESINQLSIRFTADLASVFAIDDLQLIEGNGGQEVDLENGGGSVDPEPGDAIKTTIPELIAKMPEPMQTGTVLDAANDYYFDAVVMSDVAGGNYTYNNLALATEGATEAGNGITLYGSQIEPSKLGLTRGDKVRVTLLKGMAKYQNYSGMYELTGDKNATWCKIEKLGTATITEVKIAATELVAYQAMAVTIENASIATGGVWATTTANTSHTFTAAGQNFTVFCKKSSTENPTVFENVSFVATTGNISGLAAVFSGKGQLVPRNLEDVADFSEEGPAPTTPTITGVNPTSLSFGAEGGQETITVSVENKGSNLLSVSGLSGLLSATVDNDTNVVTVTAAANTGSAVNQTLTIALAGGNSVTVPVVLAGNTTPTPSDGLTLVTTVSSIVPGTYYMAGFVGKGETIKSRVGGDNPQPAVEADKDFYAVWTGTIDGNTETDSNADLYTVPMTFADGVLETTTLPAAITDTPTGTPGEIELVASGTANGYYIKVGDQYLGSRKIESGGKIKNRRLEWSASPVEWIFSEESGRLVALCNESYLQSGTQTYKAILRTYSSPTTGTYGVYLFKKN